MAIRPSQATDGVAAEEASMPPRHRLLHRGTIAVTVVAAGVLLGPLPGAHLDRAASRVQSAGASPVECRRAAGLLRRRPRVVRLARQAVRPVPRDPKHVRRPAHLVRRPADSRDPLRRQRLVLVPSRRGHRRARRDAGVPGPVRRRNQQHRDEGVRRRRSRVERAVLAHRAGRSAPDSMSSPPSPSSDGCAEATGTSTSRS